MILSILIPTLPERAKLLQRVCEHLGEFDTNEVEILTDPRGKEVTTGRKRNELIARASGQYVVFVDDDDFPQKGYIKEIVDAIKANGHPDCVTFEGFYTENGKNRVDWVIKLGEKYEARFENGKYMFFRFPNHLACIKKSIAEKIKFPNKTQGEDYDFAVSLRDSKLLKTSFHISKQLYHYDYRTNK